MTRLSDLPTGKTNQLITQLGVNGVDAEMVELALQNPQIIRDWALWLRGAAIIVGYFEPLEEVAPNNAHLIMRDNYHGMSEGRTLLDVGLSNEEAAYFTQIPFSRQKLEACQETHILVAILYTTIRRMVIPTPEGNLNETWRRTGRFMDEGPELNWWLIQKTPLEGSLGLGLNDQIALAVQSKQLLVPANVLLQAMWRHAAESGEHLFPDVWVRTETVGQWTDRPVVSHEPDWKMPAIAHAISGTSPKVGLAVAERPDMLYEPFKASWRN